MKTKNLMTMFALSTAFVACTQDTELNEAILKTDFSDIPMVEAEFTANIGTDSRMASQFGWEVNDKIGFAWLGDGTVISGNTSGLAYQNHPLFCTDASNASFKTQTMLYVGDYFAYLPYNEGSKSVENIEFSLEGQKLSTNSNDLAPKAIYISPKKTTLTNVTTIPVGQYAAGMGKNLPLNISMLSNAASLDFTFKNVETLADFKVYGIKIDVVDATYTYNTAYTRTEASILPTEFSYVPTEYASINAWNQMDATAVSTCYGLYSASGSMAEAPTCEGVTLFNEDGLALTNGKLNTYALVLPVKETLAFAAAPAIPATYETNELVITAITNYGNIAASGIKIDGQAFAATTDLFTKFGQSGTITADFDAKTNTSFEDDVVASQAELTTLLESMAATGTTEAVEITLNPATAASPMAAFTLTDFTMPENLKAAITLTAGGNVTGIAFAGDAIINKALTISGAATVTGTMTVKNVKVGSSQVATITAARGITLDNGAVLYNEGKIEAIVTTKAAVASPAAALSTYVSNSADANVTSITNAGEVKWVKGTLPVSISGTVYTEVTNFADLMSAATGVTTARFVSECVFNNANADITVTSGITTIECYEPVTININKHSINGQVDILISNLENVVVKEGGALNIVSDDVTNTFAGAGNIAVTVANNSTLNVSTVKLSHQWNISYAGAVVLTNIAGVTPQGSKVSGSAGTWSETK